jgi:hypothetical protein
MAIPSADVFFIWGKEWGSDLSIPFIAGKGN